jgi:hypothetical protein
MLKQLKDLAENAEAGSEIAKMIEEKTKEWYNSLSFDQKKRLKDDKLSEIVDELLNINKKSSKVEIKKSPKPTQKIVKGFILRISNLKMIFTFIIEIFH